MEPRLKNIFQFSRKPFCLLSLCLLAVSPAMAQGTDQPDTSVAPAADSAGAIEQHDTGVAHFDYFEHKGNDALIDTIQLREVPGSVIDSLKKEDAFWYADRIFTRKQPKEKKRLRDVRPPSQWMSMTTLVIIVVLFLGILIWYLLENNIISRRRAIAGVRRNEEMSGENIFDIDYQKEIDKAISEANYRLAIRLLFLRLLKDLSQKNIIQYKLDRTNFDYLSQLRSSGHYDHFFRLTRNYEYTWYGKFEVSPGAFQIIKNDFENFDRKLS